MFSSCLKRIIWRRWKAIWIKYHDFQSMHFQLQSSHTIYGTSLWDCGTAVFAATICRFRVNLFLYFWAACNNQGSVGEMFVSPSIKSSTGGWRLGANQKVGLKSANEVAKISNLLLDQYGRSFWYDHLFIMYWGAWCNMEQHVWSIYLINLSNNNLMMKYLEAWGNPV